MTEQKSSTSNSLGSSGPYANSNITYEIFKTMSRTWGYRILIEGNIMIVQNTKPGLPGNFGFRTKKQAKKVAELVTSKIRNGQLPPTVTIEELKSIGALE